MAPDLTSNWTWDTATHGIGALAEATTSAGYSRTLSYDSLGRPDQTVLQINSTNYTYQTAYDTNGRMSAVTYPSGYV